MIKSKICFFNSVKTWGGGEKWHFDNSKYLSENGFDVIVATNRKSKLADKLKNQHIPVYAINITNISFLNIFKIINLIHFFKKENISTVILNLPSDVKAAGIAAKHAGVKNIIYRRGSAIPIKNSLLNKYLFKNVITSIIANSDATKKTINQNNSTLFPKDKITVIYNGIDLKKYDGQKPNKLYQRQNNEIIIGNAGRLEKQKGQKYLIDIAEKLKSQNLKFKLLIAGTGRMEDEIKKYAVEKKVEDTIIFLGFVQNIKNFMETIDIFVLTSLWEGFGYVLVEAMASSKPVIAFNLSSNPELVEHGKTGYLIDNFDISEFVNKITYLINNPDIAKQQGKLARYNVGLSFEMKIVLKEFVNYLNGLGETATNP